MIKHVLFLGILFGATSFALANSTTNLASNIESNLASFEVDGAVKLYIQGDYNFLRISGEAAAVLYRTMTVAETNSLDGAGPEVFFKTGPTYRCFAEVKDSELGTSDESNVNYYICDLRIKDIKNGR